MRKIERIKRGLFILAGLLALVLFLSQGGAAVTLAQGEAELQEYPVPGGSHPHDVAPATDGGVWYTAQYSGELGWLDPATGETKHIPLGQGSQPHGVIVGPDGAPWITDSGLNAIVRVDPATEEVQSFPLPAGAGNANLNTAAFDGQGILWFTGQNGVYGRLDPATGEVEVFEAPRGRGPYGMTATPDGSIYYASLAGSHIARIDTTTGAATAIEPPTPSQGARRVWSDSQGRIWVSEWNAGQVAVYDPATETWREWKLPGDQPLAYAVYVDDQDQVWLSDFRTNALVKFDPEQESFESFPLPSQNASVRQILGRPGEVWGAESGTDKLVVIRTGAPETTQAATASSDAPAVPDPTLFDTPWDDRSVFQAGLIQSEQATLAEQLPGASVYHIDLEISEDLVHLLGREEVRYTNQEDTPLAEVYFRLFPNLADGTSTVTRVTVNGQAVEPAYELEQSAMRVPLVQPLQPGQQVVIAIDFDVQVPTDEGGNYGTFAFLEGVLALAHFYPMISVYDDEGWNVEIAPPIGDVVYSDSAFFLTRVTAPANQLLAASGIELEREENDAVQVVTYAAGPARDFYLVASDRYTVTSRVVGETTVNSYAPADLQEGSNVALDGAEAALKSFNDRFGPYPYTEFDVVATTTFALGVEYPGVVAILLNAYEQASGSGRPLFDSVVAHEVAHQWFYSTVGNDQVDEPWLDEALAQYLTLLYFGDVYGQSGAAGFRNSLDGRWARIDHADIPIGMPVREYDGRTYGAIVYGRGPLFVETLVETMGQETFNAFLRDYYQSYRWQIATTEDFKRLAEQHCACDLTPLFEEWVYAEDSTSSGAADMAELQSCKVTPADMEGPYYLPDAPFTATIAPAGLPGDPLVVSGTVYNADCQPLSEAIVDVWQADASGQYDFSPQYLLRGRVKTDAQGRYEYTTVLPGRYGGGVARPTHIHYKVSHPEAGTLTTQLYFTGGAHGASGTSIPEALIVPLEEQAGQAGPVYRAVFNIVLPRP